MTNRSIPFSVIAERAQLPLDEVEFLAMKTFSRGLVWGSIDQLDEVINIEWVKPRALSLEQVYHCSISCLQGDQVFLTH
jgi:26S proteasome regulatory subunit N9